MKKILTVTALTFVLAGCGQRPPLGALPEDWHGANASPTEPTPELEAHVDRLLDTLAASIDDTDEADAKSLSDWRLSTILTDLTVSAQGTLGFLLKGSPSVTLYWRRVKPQAEPTKADLETSESLPLDSSPECLQALEAKIQDAASEGRVLDSSRAFGEARAQLEKFSAIARELESIPQLAQWWPSRLRLDLSIDASGTVYTGITAGGDLRLRFEWYRLMPKPAKDVGHAVASGILSVARAVGSQLDRLDKDLEDLHGFKATQFRVGFGVTGEGSIAVVKGGARLAGHVYFSRNIQKPTWPVKVEPEGSLTVEPDALPLWLPDAKADGQLVEIPAERFARGLRQSLVMSKFFAKRAQKHRSAKWRVHELKMGLDLSVGGSLGLVEVSGVAATEFVFTNYGPSAPAEVEPKVVRERPLAGTSGLSRFVAEAIAEMIEGLGELARDACLTEGEQDRVEPEGSFVDERWFFRRTLTRIRAKVGFEIPGIAKLVVVPEAELIWLRKLPSGWVGYKPGG